MRSTGAVAPEPSGVGHPPARCSSSRRRGLHRLNTLRSLLAGRERRVPTPPDEQDQGGRERLTLPMNPVPQSGGGLTGYPPSIPDRRDPAAAGLEACGQQVRVHPDRLGPDCRRRFPDPAASGA